MSLQGIGDYRPVVYKVRDGLPTAGNVALSCRGIAKTLDPGKVKVGSLVVVGTNEAYDRWTSKWTTERKLLERELELPGGEDSTYFLKVPKGSDGTEQHDLFRRFLWAFRAEALPTLHESAPPEVILLDVTHGYRVQGMLALAAASFAESEWVRERTEQYPTIRVLYGAYEGDEGESGVTEVWDMTELLRAPKLNSAIDALMRYGRADAVQLQAGLGGALTAIAPAAEQFANDLCQLRTVNLLRQSSVELGLAARQLSEQRSRDSDLPDPVGPTLQRLEEWASRLKAERPIDRQGLDAALHQAELALTLQRFAETAAILRELVVSAWMVRAAQAAGVTPAQPESGERDFDEQRKRAENALWTAAHSKDPWERACWKVMHGEPPKGERRQSGEVLPPYSLSSLRNDVLHAGSRKKPWPQGMIPKLCQNALSRVRLLVESIEKPSVLESEEVSSPRLWVLMNHDPTEAQTSAAAAIASGGMRFPPAALQGLWRDLSPSDDGTYRRDLDAIEGWVAGTAPVAGEGETPEAGDYLLVHGEPGATLQVVRAADARGLLPIYSTTKRDQFVHVGFRSFITGATVG